MIGREKTPCFSWGSSHAPADESEGMSTIKRGALHRQLHIPQDMPVPIGTLQRIVDHGVGSHITSNGVPVTVTPLLKKRAGFALSFR